MALEGLSLIQQFNGLSSFLQACLGERGHSATSWWHGAQLLSVGNGVKKILIVSHALEWAELIIFHDLSAPITLD